MAERNTPAQESLQAALVSLMLTKPIARIGVKELCSAAHVARSTFYTYYDNTDELLCEVENAHIAEIARMNETVSDPHLTAPADMRFFDATVAYVQANERDFKALLVRDPSARFIETWKTEIKHHLRRRRQASGAAPLSKLTEEVAASAVVSAITFYLQGTVSLTPKDVHTVLSKALSALDS